MVSDKELDNNEKPKEIKIYFECKVLKSVLTTSSCNKLRQRIKGVKTDTGIQLSPTVSNATNATCWKCNCWESQQRNVVDVNETETLHKVKNPSYGLKLKFRDESIARRNRK